MYISNSLNPTHRKSTLIMSNLAAATQSKISTGPRIHTTARGDMKAASWVCTNDSDLSNDEHNIRRGDLLVTLNTPNADKKMAYTPVLSCDYIPDTITSELSEYYQELGDARNILEYLLAKHYVNILVESAKGEETGAGTFNNFMKTTNFGIITNIYNSNKPNLRNVIFLYTLNVDTIAADDAPERTAQLGAIFKKYVTTLDHCKKTKTTSSEDRA